MSSEQRYVTMRNKATFTKIGNNDNVNVEAEQGKNLCSFSIIRKAVTL
jgi:hypothetical protein